MKTKFLSCLHVDNVLIEVIIIVYYQLLLKSTFSLATFILYKEKLTNSYFGKHKL